MLDWKLEDDYDLFQGDLRRLDELIAQFELWCDEKTINHKKEQERLEEFVEMETNFNEQVESIRADIEANRSHEEANRYETQVDEKLEKFKETQEAIYAWIKEIELLNVMIMKSNLLVKYRERLEEIVSK